MPNQYRWKIFMSITSRMIISILVALDGICWGCCCSMLGLLIECWSLKELRVLFWEQLCWERLRQLTLFHWRKRALKTSLWSSKWILTSKNLKRLLSIHGKAWEITQTDQLESLTASFFWVTSILQKSSRQLKILSFWVQTHL